MKRKRAIRDLSSSWIGTILALALIFMTATAGCGGSDADSSGSTTTEIPTVENEISREADTGLPEVGSETEPTDPPSGVIETESETAEVEDTTPIEYPAGILPERTSTDPTFGYQPGNPVLVGSDDLMQGPKMERQYLRRLRDAQFRPYTYERLGSYGRNPDGHLVDGYELTDADGNTVMIYIDMYHADASPYDAMVPKGMYFRE